MREKGERGGEKRSDAWEKKRMGGGEAEQPEGV